MTTRMERYVQLRLENPKMGHCAASAAAGYASGAPQTAVRAYRFALKAKSEPRAEEWVQSELERVEADIARRAQMAAELRSKLRAIRALTKKRVSA